MPREKHAMCEGAGQGETVLEEFSARSLRRSLLCTFHSHRALSPGSGLFRALFGLAALCDREQFKEAVAPRETFYNRQCVTLISNNLSHFDHIGRNKTGGFLLSSSPTSACQVKVDELKTKSSSRPTASVKPASTPTSSCSAPESDENMDPQTLSATARNVAELRAFLEHPEDDHRVSELQRQFAAILHANKCMKQTQNNMCTLPICPQWKVVLLHYGNCDQGDECQFDNCATSRTLLGHFKTCQVSCCRFCSPLKTKGKHRDSRRRTESASSSRSFFIQSPGSSCSFEQTSFASANGLSSASQAYFRKWGTWGDIESTTTFYTTTEVHLAGEDGDNDEQEEEPGVNREERIQRELVVMLHVQKCADMDVDDPNRRENVSCAVPHCSRMKRTLIHVAMCKGEDCTFPECDVTRAIINHWLRCRRDSCKLCSPVLKFMPALDGEEFDGDGKLVNLLYAASASLIKLEQADVDAQCKVLASECNAVDMGDPLSEHGHSSSTWLPEPYVATSSHIHGEKRHHDAEEVTDNFPSTSEHVFKRPKNY